MSRRRRLGQNFLADPNILDVIERLAALEAGDVVLEVGGGEGVLSVRLAARARHLHVVELDPRLEGELRARLAGRDNFSLHLADALELDLPGLRPAPTRVVANLPYSVAATVILRTIEELPSVRRWLVMVQREVGERLAAGPATAAYGVPSVLAQLACTVRVARAIPRTVFRPVPHVDSVLVALERTGPGAPPELRRFVRDAFAHRRKALARSLALSGHWGEDVVDRTRAGLRGLGYPADARAERLAPDELAALHERVAG